MTKSIYPISDEIQFKISGKTGVIYLTRMKALNAVSMDMVMHISDVLFNWEQDENVEQVVIHAEGEKAFSAGGDIRQLHKMALEDDPRRHAFYWHEYRLNQYMKSYPKPYIALINGIVMGGGVGVSFHGSHRIVGERTRFAMPETAIGLFPDVGGSHILSHLEGDIGLLIGLTGVQLNAKDCVDLGLATHYVAQQSWENMQIALLEGMPIETLVTSFHSQPEMQTHLSTRHHTLAAQIAKNGLANTIDTLEDQANSGKTLDEVDAWFLKEIKKKSPLALAISERAYHTAKSLDFDSAMQMEYRMVQRVLERTDFTEGIRALIVDKDNQPHWQHQHVGDILAQEVDQFFAPFSEEEASAHPISKKELHFKR